ncbi:hypothetical protein [Planobispora longispora]|uniref:Uncharacterized protein n=1 Tax=Planobispora longispora TaxID=28887 RepID=A0A8J3RII4_9ACTN|nr:hypothetical protein [Planobispora longispora]GIH74826.1 hypothetical protein Plo01_12550 [Planobispora longispora]
MLLLGVLWLVLTPACLWFLVRGRGLPRAGALLTLAGLEAATIWFDAGAGPRTPLAQPAASSAGPASSASSASSVTQPSGAAAPCSGRLPVPERAKLVAHEDGIRAVALSWTAAPDECATATVVLRHRNQRIKVWLSEGPGGHRSPDAFRVPVTVSDGVASARVRLAPPLPGGTGLTTVDGRTGRPIALR